MSKIGRNRKDRHYDGFNRVSKWKPIEAKKEVIIEIRTKSQSGVEYTKYKSVNP